MTLSVLAGLVACGDDSSMNTGGNERPPPLLVAGFSTPESAHFHAPTGDWFVSNIAGQTGAKDGLGWITRLNRDGQITDARWIDRLDSPAGITSDDRNLYVADIDVVRVIDIATAQQTALIAVKDAGFVNDLALAPDGTLYISDSFAQAVYRRRPGQALELVKQDPSLEFPNGLLWREGRLLVASTGPFTDFDTEGPLQWLDVADGALETTQEGLQGKLDGIQADGPVVWVTDFRGLLLRLENGEVQVRDLTAEGLVSAADLGYDRERGVLGVPDLFGDQVAFIVTKR